MKNAAFLGRPGGRGLSTVELKLWLEATRNVVPMGAARLPAILEEQAQREGPDCSPAVKPPKQEKAEVAARQDAARTHRAPPPIGRRLRQKLLRGQVAPDAVIDLHGLHQREAFLALRSFLLQAQSGGARLVLIVTGKGNRLGQSNFTPGVLRRRVPDWLCGAEYRPVVAGFGEAARPHGGSGALYVLLKRSGHAKSKAQTP